jgi:hypothetical protein
LTNVNSLQNLKKLTVIQAARELVTINILLAAVAEMAYLMLFTAIRRQIQLCLLADKGIEQR